MCIHKTNTITNNIKHTKLESNKLDLDWDNCDYISTDDLSNCELDNTSLNILQYNVRGILSKTHDLTEILNMTTKTKIHVVILCETWLTDANTSRLHIPGYTYVGKVRQGKKGGGVGFLVRDDLKFRKQPDLEVTSEILENNFIELKCNRENVLIGSLYRPPNTNEKKFLSCYKKLVTNLSKQKLPYIIGLDHNMDLLKIDRHEPTSQFIEITLDKGLIPCVTRPTRITHTSATLIDNVFVEARLHHNARSSIIVMDLSDHLPSLITIPDIFVTKLTATKKEVRKLTDARVSDINKELGKIDWDNILKSSSSNNPLNTNVTCSNRLSKQAVIRNNKTYNTTENDVTCNNKFDAFHKTLMGTINNHAPKKTITL